MIVFLVYLCICNLPSYVFWIRRLINQIDLIEVLSDIAAVLALVFL